MPDYNKEAEGTNEGIKKALESIPPAMILRFSSADTPGVLVDDFDAVQPEPGHMSAVRGA